MSDSAALVEADLEAARLAAREGRGADAESAYARVLASAADKTDADQAEALHFCAMRALLRGDATSALGQLERAAALDGENAPILKNLALAHIALDRRDEARRVLERALALDPEFFVARLHLGSVLERSAHTHAALTQYFTAIMKAQDKGRWLNDETTPPALRELVLHAMQVVDAGRKNLFEAALEPLRVQYGDTALRRVRHCLDIYLGISPPNYPDPRQLPKFLYFPELPTTAYFDRALFPWYAELEGNVEIIREELSAVLCDEQGIEPFLKFDSPEDAAQYLAGTDSKPAWDAFFFYRHGVRIDANCARCPRTAAIIESLPIARIREHAPEICFSLLTPGTHILPHRGVTNSRVVTHLPLIVPENCAIKVGGELRVWEEGQCFTFDDTFEHEAWNRGTSTRVVMLMDCWNPYLTQIEREALAPLIGAIGDFNRECGISEQ
jgi:aspartate beta-hydroxylase